MFLFSKLHPPLPGRRSASLWTSPPCVDVTEARTPARTRDAEHPRAHRCWSGSDRRARLGGTERIKLGDGGEDRPVCVRQEPQSAGNDARNESLRGQQDLKSCGPSIWTLYIYSRHFPLYLPPPLIRNIRIRTDIFQLTVLFVEAV